MTDNGHEGQNEVNNNEPNLHMSESDSDDDKDFELTVDMMLDDFDDERTLDEEEEKESGDPADELNCLLTEGELPLDQLLCRFNLPPDFADRSNVEANESRPEPTTRRMLLLRSGLRDGCSSSDDESTPILDWKKHTNVGPEYQAVVDEFTLRAEEKDSREYGTLIWNPAKISEKLVIRFLKNIALSSRLPDLIPDDEIALSFLSTLNYDVNKAISQWKALGEEIKPLKFTSEECDAFEEGLAEYGKNFFMLQKHKLSQRKVSELVEFYYFWKKTERHDVFISRCKSDKKGLTNKAFNTDLMERCCDEFENQASHTDATSDLPVQNVSNQPIQSNAKESPMSNGRNS